MYPKVGEVWRAKPLLKTVNDWKLLTVTSVDPLNDRVYYTTDDPSWKHGEFYASIEMFFSYFDKVGA